MPGGEPRRRARRRRRAIVALLLLALALGSLPLLLPRPTADFAARGGRPPEGASIPLTPLPAPASHGEAVDGPEDVLAEPDGSLLTGDAHGRILRLDADGTTTVLAEVGGRPLGLRRAPDGGLLVAVHGRGLVRVERDGTVTVLADSVEGEPMTFPNGVAVAADGTAYVTVSSTRLHAGTLGDGEASYLLPSLLEGRPAGRLLRVDPDGRTTVVADGLAFPNGIVLTADGRSALVAESTAYRLVRIDLDTGAVEPVGPVLPGIPDNLSRAPDGTVLVGLYDRSPALERWVLPWATTRELAARVPTRLLVGGGLGGSVLVLAEDGTVRGRHGPLEDAPTGITAWSGTWYLGSLTDGPVRAVPAP